MYIYIYTYTYVYIYIYMYLRCAEQCTREQTMTNSRRQIQRSKLNISPRTNPCNNVTGPVKLLRLPVHWTDKTLLI